MNSDREAGADDGFGSRIDVLASLVGGLIVLARKSGLSRRVLDKYRSGESDPSRTRLLALARAGGVRLEWLATGQGPMREEERSDEKVSPPHIQTIDDGLMGRISDGIERVYREENARIAPSQLVRLAARIYVDLAATCDTAEEIEGALKLRLRLLREDFRKPNDGSSGKRLA